MEAINERFKALRKECGLAQDVFGKALGLSKSGVCDIEAGRRKVTEQHIIMLSHWEEHRVNIDWLRTGEGEMFLPEPKSEIQSFMEQHQDASAIDRAIMNAYFTMDEQQRKVFYEFCLRVAGQSDSITPVLNATNAVADAEAAYEKSLGIAQSKKSSVLPTIADTSKTGTDSK